MCIIYMMRNDCLCWLFLVTVDIIRDWLPQVTELPFCTGIELGRCTAPSTVFSQPYGKKRPFGVLFMVFKSKRLIRMKLMHGNTDSISHVPILTWPGVMSSLTSQGSVNDITQHFSLNWFLVLSFDTKCPTWNVDGKFWWQTNVMEICPLFWLMCPSWEQYHWKHFHGYFLIPTLWQMLLHSIIKWCKC